MDLVLGLGRWLVLCSMSPFPRTAILKLGMAGVNKE
jgi:hypothetical protein